MVCILSGIRREVTRTKIQISAIEFKIYDRLGERPKQRYNMYTLYKKKKK